MTAITPDPAPIVEATALIRAGRYDEAVALLTAAIPDLPRAQRRNAHSYIGLAYWFAQRWADALGFFQTAADGSEIPEDHFNVAMARVKVGDIEGAHAAWEQVFALSYAHRDAPETSSFFDKKLLFACALRDAGACDARGLDLLERQLLPFFTNNRVTDASFWGLRGVPGFEPVMNALFDYYRALGRTAADWAALLDRVEPAVDDDGKATCAALRERWKAARSV